MKNKIDWLIIVSDDGVFGGAEHIQLQITEYLVRENNRCMVYFLKNTRYGKWDHLSKKCQLIYSPFSSYFLGYIYLIPFIIKTSLSGQIKRAFSSQTLINAMLGLMKKIGVLGKTKIIVRESTSVFKQIKGLKATRYKMAYVIGYQKIDSIIFQTAIMKSNLLEEVPSLKNKKGLFVLSNPLNIELIQKKSLENFKYQLELLSTSLNISDRIKLIGYVDNPYPYFKHAKACVVSSRVEGFPNVLLQMMTCNNKVISTLCAGDIENINGIYKSQTENAEELSKQIFNSLTENTDDNRNKFDAFLKKRTFKKYMDSIMQM